MKKIKKKNTETADSPKNEKDYVHIYFEKEWAQKYIDPLVIEGSYATRTAFVRQAIIEKLEKMNRYEHIKNA